MICDDDFIVNGRPAVDYKVLPHKGANILQKNMFNDLLQLSPLFSWEEKWPPIQSRRKKHRLCISQCKLFNNFDS